MLDYQIFTRRMRGLETGPVMHRISGSLGERSRRGRQGGDGVWNGEILHAREVAWGDFDKRRRGGGTVSASGVGNTLERVGAVGAQGGYGAEQTTGVGVHGSVKDVVDGRHLDYGAGVHDSDTMRDLRDDSEVMRDEEHGQA